MKTIAYKDGLADAAALHACAPEYWYYDQPDQEKDYRLGYGLGMDLNLMRQGIHTPKFIREMYTPQKNPALMN